MNPLEPSVALLAKIGSGLAHAEEYFSEEGYWTDRESFNGVMRDPEVREWLAAMGELSLVPVKRS